MTAHSVRLLLVLVLAAGCSTPAVPDLSPATWQTDYDDFMAAQLIDRTTAGVATGANGAVTVAYNGLAARAGLEALKQGGNAIDAAMTTALTQVALTAGAPISYFGIMSLVYYDAASGAVHTMNAEWNTVRGEDDPMSIPGGVDLTTPEGIYGTAVSGRTALVGGFLKGVGAAHERFGSLPWPQLFAPAIHVAEEGMPVSRKMAGYFEARRNDLARLDETRATMLRPDGSPYAEGDTFRQPALAETLRAVADAGTDYMYRGPWAEKLVAAVQAEGGRMTLEDLAAYEVIWGEPLRAPLGDFELVTNRPPNNGGVAMIEAHNIALAAGIVEDGLWWESPDALRKALDATQLGYIDRLPPATLEMVYPGLEISSESRVTPEYAAQMWARIEAGARLTQWAPPSEPRHSDDVVVIDRHGNVAAITHSINAVLWGKTAIVVDGVTVGDPGSFQQAQIAATEPGARLASPTETGILLRDGQAVLGFASMGSGLHQRTFLGLMGVTQYGMTVDQAINAPDFFLPRIDPSTFQTTFRVIAGQFPAEVLDGTGYG
ncbi:MAG: hypothetical protein HKN93_03055, partial [Acidimicrobiia bacterium]|nr:hypothetical protein [Acidimicrobiia bacterium]